MTSVAGDSFFRPTTHWRARGANIRSPRARATRRAQGGDRRDARRPGRRALGLMALGATCVQKLDGSRDSAIHTKYRISLRSSSMREPRYPLPRVVLFHERSHYPPAPANRASGASSLVQVPWRKSRRGSLFIQRMHTLPREAPCTSPIEAVKGGE